MLFTEDQLHLDPNPLQILDEAIYLTEKEAVIYPQMVTIVENSRLQSYVIDFNGIRRLSEQHGIDYIDAVIAVAEADGIDLDNACIAIDEADIIEYPELSTIGPIVVTPLSEDNPEYVFTEFLLEQFMSESDDWDENELAHLLLEMSWNDLMKELNVFRDKNGLKDDAAKKLWNKMARFAHPDMHVRSGEEAPSSAVRKVKDAIRQMGGNPTFSSGSFTQEPPKSQPPNGSNNSGGNSGSTGSNVLASSIKGSFGSTGNGLGKKLAVGAGIAAAIDGGILAYKQYQDKPKSVIAKRVAALRGIYQKFLYNAKANPEKAGIFKRMAAKVLGVIDKLMSFIQRKADGQ